MKGIRATPEINTKITLFRVHKQFATRVHTLFYMSPRSATRALPYAQYQDKSHLNQLANTPGELDKTPWCLIGIVPNLVLITICPQYKICICFLFKRASFIMKYVFILYKQASLKYQLTTFTPLSYTPDICSTFAIKFEILCSCK